MTKISENLPKSAKIDKNQLKLTKPLDNFTCDYLREPFYNWNPPNQNTLVAACINDINYQNEIDDLHDIIDDADDDDDNDLDTQQQQQHDTDVTLPPVEGHFQGLGDRLTDTNVTFIPADGHVQVHCNNSQKLLPKGISKITELTLDLFENNYHLFAQKVSSPDNGLFIRAILIKSREVIFNFTYKIEGTQNVWITTIVSADTACKLYLPLAQKGDTLLCSLGEGHDCVHVLITRNAHIANFIKTKYWLPRPDSFLA